MNQSKYGWLLWAVISFLVTACTLPQAKKFSSQIFLFPSSSNFKTESASKPRKSASIRSSKKPTKKKAAPSAPKKAITKKQSQHPTKAISSKKRSASLVPKTKKVKKMAPPSPKQPTAEKKQPTLEEKQTVVAKQKPVVVKKQEVTYDIPIRHNSRVQERIDFYLTKGRNILIKGIERSGKYLPLFQKELQQVGLPQDLAYLAATESNYDPTARSHAGAAGLWQFVKTTGQQYDLKQNQWMDERLDAVKSTQAATQHLKDLFAQFGDWELALAAYNAGDKQVQKAIQKAKAQNRPVDYWTLNLPQETQKYVADYMAVTIISKNLKKYELQHIAKASPWDLKKMTLSTDFSLQEVAERSKMPLKQLWQHNAAYLYAVPPLNQKKYNLYLPKAHHLPFVISLYKKATPDKQWKTKFAKQSKRLTQLLKKYGSLSYIQVKKGDSLWKLSRTFHTTEKRLRQWNRINKKGFLKIGQKLKIYHPTWKVVYELNQLPKEVADSSKKSTTVQPADT